MTFTHDMAGQLRDRLPAFDPGTKAATDELTRSYLSHYGLDRLTAPWPVHHSLGTFDSLDYRLCCQLFRIPEVNRKGTVVIVHGYYDHVGLFRHPIEHCLSQGYSVLAFDLPGHGLSTGDPASIETFDHYSQALSDCLRLARVAGRRDREPGRNDNRTAGRDVADDGNTDIENTESDESLSGSGRRSDSEERVHIMAQSTGAAAVIHGLLNKDRFELGTLSEILLLAPLLRPVGWAAGLRTYRLMRLFVRRVKRDFATNSHDEEFLRFIAEQDPLQCRYLKVDWVRSLKMYLEDFERADVSTSPLHIIQGTEDTTVDWHYNLPRLTDKFPAARTHIIEGARHHLVNESAEYRTKLFDIVDHILESP